MRKNSTFRKAFGFAASVCAVILLSAILCSGVPKTFARFLSAENAAETAGAAAFSVDLKVEETAASIVQNQKYEYSGIISIDNRSETSVGYNLIVTLAGLEEWPPGMQVTLLDGDREIADCEYQKGCCIFSDDSWTLRPGESAEHRYGLRCSTTYDTPASDYTFNISSYTYQLED